ncbi:MAG TPA: hypothetical protein VF618_23905 [Thermoanaerobaculia bacterium]
MSDPIIAYLTSRPEAATFLLPAGMERTVAELFPREMMLPQPIRIYPADETQPPTLGYPVAESSVMKELDARLDRWLTEETAWQVKRVDNLRDKAQAALAAYTSQLMKVVENAMMGSLLNDFHAIFWLAHSLDLSRQFSTIPRRVSAIDIQAGRTQGDILKYRIFGRWVSETREQMTQLVARAAALLDGEEQHGLHFFRLLQDDVLILTEEFIGPDLRELRSFIQGYLRRDFQSFRDAFERLRTSTAEVLQKDRTFRAALPLFGVTAEQGITVAMLFDARFQTFVFEQPAVQNVLTREEREQFHLIARRMREFAVLSQLRRGLVWMTATPDGQIVAAGRSGSKYSRSTRPMDFGRHGVVDPMVHRFGLIYDISNFSETLGNLRRAGGKEEIKSYRQMLVFQRKLEHVADRHMLVFEKFLGDGGFYTTRRALRLVRAAVEIQRFYSEMKRKGFAFNKGMRVALNYGYYRLLPLRMSAETNQRITEFYGPGIVELSRLTTGKANKEIEEIAAFLIAHGYEQQKVQQFFAPLSRGVDVIDHLQHAREFYAYLNATGHLVNEGIVASMPFLQELSNELAHEAQQLYRIRTGYGSYIGFAPAVSGLEFIGIRLLGMVSLKGLDDIDVGEIVPFAPGEAEATAIDEHEPLVMLLRQELHHFDTDTLPLAMIEGLDMTTTTERAIASELVICARSEPGYDDEVLIGEWDPRSDDVRRPVRLPRGDFQRLFSMRGELTTESLEGKKEVVREMYERLCDRSMEPTLALADFRDAGEYEAFVLGDVVEKL